MIGGKEQCHERGKDDLLWLFLWFILSVTVSCRAGLRLWSTRSAPEGLLLQHPALPDRETGFLLHNVLECEAPLVQISHWACLLSPVSWLLSHWSSTSCLVPDWLEISWQAVHSLAQCWLTRASSCCQGCILTFSSGQLVVCGARPRVPRVRWRGSSCAQAGPGPRQLCLSEVGSGTARRKNKI